MLWQNRGKARYLQQTALVQYDTNKMASSESGDGGSTGGGDGAVGRPAKEQEDHDQMMSMETDEEGSKMGTEGGNKLPRCWT